DVPSLLAEFMRGVGIVGSFSNLLIEPAANPAQSYPQLLQDDYAFVVGAIATEDPRRTNADHEMKATFRRAAGRIYQGIMPFWLVSASLLAAFDALRRLRRRSVFMPEHVILFAGMFLSAASLIGLLAVIDTLVGPAISSAEYTSGLIPLLLFSLSFTTAVDGSVARRLIRRHRRGR